MCCQALPEGDAPIGATGQDPGMRHSFGFGAHAHVRIQTEAQQEAAQQGGVVLAVSLRRTHQSRVFRAAKLWQFSLNRGVTSRNNEPLL